MTSPPGTSPPGASRPGTEQRLRVRPARTADVPIVEHLVGEYARRRILLAKERVTLYEDVQEFLVAEDAAPGSGGTVVGCGALHVMWEDLAEVRTLAVDPEWLGRGVGSAIIEGLLGKAYDLGVTRLFCLTFEVDFFTRHGFRVIEGTPVAPPVYQELLRSMDEGVAEFLDLARVKPNTLGNTRMIRDLV